MVKHKMARKQIDKYLREHPGSKMSDIEDYVMSRNKYSPDRRGLVVMMRRDPKYVIINEGSSPELWAIKEGYDDSDSNNRWETRI